jgi:hypothetical protein
MQLPLMKLDSCTASITPGAISIAYASLLFWKNRLLFNSITGAVKVILKLTSYCHVRYVFGAGNRWRLVSGQLNL